MANFISTIGNIWKITELRQRLVFTLLALVAVRIGSFITIPGVDVDMLRAANQAADSGGTIFGLYDMFVGGAFSQAAIFALGIMPYISASIILQIAGVVLPELQKLQREGEDGRRRINQYTRMLTVGLAALQAWGVSIKIAQTAGPNGAMVVPEAGLFWTLSAILIMTAGTIALMWIGEQITERGIGNGISLIIMIGIIARFPTAVKQEIQMISDNARNPVVDIVLLVLLAGIIASVILVTQGA
ncbi:MAG: preprotein translocase subunit SecY, partial [Candidatus Kapaibacteriota bacterium]